MMNRRSLFAILAGVALVLLLAAGGSLYWILSKSPLPLLLTGVKDNPAAAVFIPKQAPVVVSLLANPERLETFVRSATPLRQRKRAQAELEQLQQGLLANTGADYNEDIQPWLGDELTFALTASDFDRDGDNGEQPGYLWVADSKDGDAAREFLQSYYAKDAIAGTSELVSEPYKGVNLIYRRNLTDNTTTSASAVVGDRFVLFANHPRILREALNNAQAVDLNLQRNPAYQKALSTLQGPRIGVSVIDLPALAGFVAKQPVPPELQQTLTVGLALSRQGLIAKTALAGFKGDENVSPALSQPVKALELIPARAMAAAAGTDLQQQWEQVSTGVTPDSAPAQLLDRVVSRLNESLDIDVVEEIFSWARGEYAIALLPPAEENRPNWVFVAQKTPEAEAAIARFDTLARQRDLSVGNFTLGDRKIAVWTKLEASEEQPATRLEASVKGARTQTDDFVIFGSSLDGLGQALGDGDRSLLVKEEFKDAIALLPKQNDGYVYLDWTQSESLFEKNIPLFPIVEFAGQPLFRNLRSLVLSSNGKENGIGRATVFLKFGTGQS
ncbi:MAG: DUF3352 domain-containing protein [Cyanobacteriota bacterium]|nr:DUF3352 domain-containing protein [Cyanobacteriota bacterium]